MIERVHRAGKLIDIGADLAGHGISERGFQTGRQPCDGQHQFLLQFRVRRADGQMLPVAEFGQDALDPHNGIENIRPGIAFKRRKAIQVKDIILGGLVGQVAVFRAPMAMRRVVSST